MMENVARPCMPWHASTKSAPALSQARGLDGETLPGDMSALSQARGLEGETLPGDMRASPAVTGVFELPTMLLQQLLFSPRTRQNSGLCCTAV